MPRAAGEHWLNAWNWMKEVKPREPEEDIDFSDEDEQPGAGVAGEAEQTLIEQEAQGGLGS